MVEKKNKFLLIIGASGFVGCEIEKQACLYYDRTIGTYNNSIDNEQLIHFDLQECTIDELRNITNVSSGSLHAIICSSICLPDKCKAEPELSRSINVLNTIKLYDYLIEAGYKVAFLSTDNVYSGREKTYREMDEKTPANLYAKQKSEVEDYILSSNTESLVFRFSKIVSPFRSAKNIFSEWERAALTNSDVTCIQNMTYSPISVIEGARIILQALQSDLKGCYHVGGLPIMRSDLARLFLSQDCNYTGEIVEKNISAFSFLDKRPLNVKLDSSKIQKDLSIKITAIEEVIHEYYTNSDC